MSAALYTISHKTTRSVLAVVSLEKQSLTDAAAWDGFRTSLVGEDKLTFPTFGTHKIVALATDQLAVDEVDADAATARLLSGDPYAYEIVKAPDSEPGDGKVKTLSTPGNQATPTLRTNKELKVTLANPPTEPTQVCIVFEGEGPKLVTITAPSNSATITVAAPVTATHVYQVLVLATGSPVFSGLVTATI